MFGRIPYSSENKQPPKISNTYQNYDNFGLSYNDFGRHYVQKSVAYFRKNTVLYLLYNLASCNTWCGPGGIIIMYY